MLKKWSFIASSFPAAVEWNAFISFSFGERKGVDFTGGGGDLHFLRGNVLYRVTGPRDPLTSGDFDTGTVRQRQAGT